jgi:hypothetical protein
MALANSDLASGGFTTQNCIWFLPTRQIKTFHPRSAGMALYRDAIIDVRDDVDGFDIIFQYFPASQLVPVESS